MAGADSGGQAAAAAPQGRRRRAVIFLASTPNDRIHNMFSRRHVFALAAFLVLLATAGPAVAQFNPYAPGYYPPPAPYVSGWGPGGVLAGQAQVMQAAGQLGIDQEKARIERQKYYQEKLANKKARSEE